MLTLNKTRIGAPVAPTKGILAGFDLFKGLPPVKLMELERKMVERKFQKGDSIFLEGDPADQVWFVKEGHIKAQVCTPNGRCQTLCMVGPRSMFGSCCALGGGTYPCHTVAETEVSVVSFPMGDFLGLLTAYPSVALALAAQLSRRLKQSKEFQTFEQESVEKRILHVLVGLADQFGNTVPLTRKEIAEMAGTVVETCIRTFSRLEEAGLVSCTRGRIVIKDVRALDQRLKTTE